MDYFISTVNFRDWFKDFKISTILKNIKGNYNLEICSGHTVEFNIEETINMLMDWSKEYKKKFILHNFSPPEKSNIVVNLSSHDEKKRKQVTEFLKNRIKYTNELGRNYYSFHAGYTVDYEFGKKNYIHHISHEESVRIFIEELVEIARYAEKKNVNIGIENHNVEKNNKSNMIMYSPHDFKFLFDEIKSNNLYLHLDVGHLKISSNTYGFDKIKFLEDFSDKIIAVHLNENNGLIDTHKPINQNSWFIPHLKKLSKLNYITFETISKSFDEIDQMINLIINEYKIK